MYHIKKLKILNTSIIFSAIISLLYLMGSIILYGSIGLIEFIFSQRTYMLRELLDGDAILPWLAILVPVALGAWGLGALIALIYNLLAKAGRGIEIEIELLKEEK